MCEQVICRTMGSFNRSEIIYNDTVVNSTFFSNLQAFPPWIITTEYAVKITAYSIILAVSVLANTFLLYAVKKNANGQMRTSSNFVLVSLSISNLIITVTCIPQRIESYIVGSYAWHVPGTFGLYLCKVTFFLADLGVAASFLATVVLSLDWFLAVTFPLKKRKNVQITRYGILLTWILATCYAAPIFYSTKLRQFLGEIFCTKGVESIPAWNTIKIVLLGPLPLLLVVTLNSAVIAKLWCRRIPGDHTKRYSFKLARAAIKRQKNKKAFRLLLTVILIFYICFLPYWIAFIDITYFKTKEISGSYQFLFSAVCLAFSSSALTPSALIILCEKFRVEAVFVLRSILGQRALRRVAIEEIQTKTQTKTQNFNNHFERTYIGTQC